MKQLVGTHAPVGFVRSSCPFTRSYIAEKCPTSDTRHRATELSRVSVEVQVPSNTRLSAAMFLLASIHFLALSRIRFADLLACRLCSVILVSYAKPNQY